MLTTGLQVLCSVFQPPILSEICGIVTFYWIGSSVVVVGVLVVVDVAVLVVDVVVDVLVVEVVTLSVVVGRFLSLH